MADVGDSVTRLEALEDGSFICLIGSKLFKFSREGETLRSLEEKTAPIGFLARQNGEILLMDVRGVKVYNKDFQLRREIQIPVLNDCVGMAEDKLGNLITINVNKSESKITRPGSASIFIIDVTEGHVIRVIDLQDIIEALKDSIKRPNAKSSIGFVAFKNDVFYVVGLYIFILQDLNPSIESLFLDRLRPELCLRGPREWRQCLDVRLGGSRRAPVPRSQLSGGGPGWRHDRVGQPQRQDAGCRHGPGVPRIRRGGKVIELMLFVMICTLQVDQQLYEPSLLCVDEKKGEIYVFNKGERNILRYKM